MPGLVPELHGKKWAYFKLKRVITMNTHVSGNIEGVLSRSEMKQIMAGSDPQEESDSNICADWAVDCVCLDGTAHGCQTSGDCTALCSF
jgi:hypothetical protein